MGASLASPTHLLILLVVCLLLFGAKRLPEIGRSLGSGLHEFKTTVSGADGITNIGEGTNEMHAAALPEVARTAGVPRETTSARERTPSDEL